MKKSQITQTREDYLRAIYKLELSKQKIGVLNIAQSLHLSKSTVSERLQELFQIGYITYKKYRPIHLTVEGRRIAKKITYKHRIIEVFLHDMLKFPKDKIHEEAHKLEHAFSDEVVKRLEQFVGNPSVDPHGEKIPDINL